MTPTVPDEVAAILRHYVFVYTDPRTNQPFYVGRGRDHSMYAHLDDESECETSRRIAEIRAADAEPQIDLLRYGLSEGEALLVEAAAIDLLGKGNLTNRLSGQGDGYPRISSHDVIATFGAKSVAVQHKAMLITINRHYRSDMTRDELYEATRGIWKVGKKREKVEYAMAVYRGVVHEVYRIEHPWVPAGTLTYATRHSDHFKGSKRWEFQGVVAEEIRDVYVGFSVGEGGQNPIRYKNV